uniref:tRNA (uracil-O(2)-)-methyltransferase n=2 Tax=Schistocephalus solidus TaxID=70667 RepID=A0A0V0J7P0_SCHSO
MDVKNLQIFSPQWFIECLETRLCHWASLSLDHSPPSLKLVDYQNYQKVYLQLKTYYWEYLRTVRLFVTLSNNFQSWCEKTDPEKFIHEDFGIAAYLICVWSNVKKEDVFFVDIGCGNGLLVYLLISEGFHGIGIDIKGRGIWKQYPARVAAALKEETLDPSTHPGFPKATLLIGNHSDELTPWLPILATKSNSECQVFTIPCCPFSLYQKFNDGHYNQQLKDGVYCQLTGGPQPSSAFTTEFPKEHSRLAEEGFWRGRYRRYIRYLENVLRICGFEPELDILRIPSTKRV